MDSKSGTVSVGQCQRGTTALRKVVFTYEWTIEHFGDFLQRKYEIHSPLFKFNHQHATDWKLVSYIQESYPVGANLAVSLVKMSNHGRPDAVKYKICIVSRGRSSCVQVKEKIFKERLDFDECPLVSHVDLIDKKLLENNNLVLRCEMNVLVPELPSDPELSSDTLMSAEPSTPGSDYNNLSSPVSCAPSMPSKYPRKLKDLDISYNVLDKGDIFGNLLDEKSPSSLQDDLNILSDDFGRLYMNKQFTDITVFAEGVPICAHKAVLSARSEFFQKICAQKTIKNTITILDVKSTVVEEVLHYLYTGKIRTLSFDFDLDMLSAAKKFSLLPLQTLLIGYLKPNISTMNVKEAFQTSIDLKLGDLQQLCLEFDNSHQLRILGSRKENVNIMKDALLPL